MEYFLTLGRVPGKRESPQSEGGYKIYLTTGDRMQWVDFGGGGRREPNGLPAQKRNGLPTPQAAWDWVEKHLLVNEDLVQYPLRSHSVWPYREDSVRMPKMFWETSRPINYHVSSAIDKVTDPNGLEDLEQLLDRSRDVTEYTAPRRPNQGTFRKAVFERYGARCAFCRVSVRDLLDAAHVIDWTAKGADVAENGIVLCKLHHRAFDCDLLAIEPETLELVSRRQQFASSDLHVEFSNVLHMSALPAVVALRWRWSSRNLEQDVD